MFPLRPPFAGDAALQEMLADTLAEVVALLSAESGVVMLVDPGSGDRYPAAGVGLDGASAVPEAARYETLLRGRDGTVLGTLEAGFSAPQRPSEGVRGRVELLARLAGAAIDNALAYRHAALQSAGRTAAESELERLLEREREAKRRADFLAEASRLLGSSLQYEPTLATVASLALPFLGSWCFVDLVEPDGTMRRVAVIHPDPEKQRLARLLENGWPPERDDPLGAPRAIRTRVSETLPHISDEMLVQAAHGEENLRILRALGIGSLIVAPIIARDEVLGAITFVSADTGHQYTGDDVGLADEIASRSAAAIENARLLRAAEEANRAKSVFLSTMSHELRTPLNAIGGYADLLEMEIKGPVTTAQREQIARIRTNQRHLLSLVNSVLDFAKIDAGRMEYHIGPVAVAAAVADMESVVAPLAAARGISFPSHCASSRLVVRADREKLAQILVNLFSNAVKFTGRGGVISLHCEQVDGRIRFRVEDSGIGIAPEHLEHIFDPFMQVSEGNTRKQEGTGLGLAISRNLARGMGGEITVESTLGAGSTFIVELPAAEEAELDPEPLASRSGTEAQWRGAERRSGIERRAKEPGAGDPVMV